MRKANFFLVRTGKSIEDFQTLALVSASASMVFMLTFSFAPESPIHLVKKENLARARANLQFLRWNYDVEEELKRIKDNMKEADAGKPKISDLILSKATSKAMAISLGLMVFQQFSGINVILFHAAQIFNDSGTSLPGNVCAIYIGLLQVSLINLFPFYLLLHRSNIAMDNKVKAIFAFALFVLIFRWKYCANTPSGKQEK